MQLYEQIIIYHQAPVRFRGNHMSASLISLEEIRNI